MVSGGKVRPEVAILARAEKRVLEAANALGLSPGARARLGVTLPDPEPPEEEVDPLEKIIRENQARLAQTMGSGHNL
jgi:phage terminase small subunit